MSDYKDLLPLNDAIDRTIACRNAFFESRSTTTVPLDDLSGRILAEDLTARANSPPSDRATMDGYAFAAADENPLEIIDQSVFPESTPPALEAGQAIKIATGAPLPERADTVCKRENATIEDGRLVRPALEAGAYVYKRGSNVTAGDRLYKTGERLSALDAILLRDMGRETVEIYEPFSVGVLATGTEIHEGRYTDLDSPMLCSLLRSWGHEPTYEGSVPDEGSRVEARIDELADRHDIIVTTGGTSVGKKDFVLDAMDSLGEILFHRVRVRPGKPIALAQLPGDDTLAVAIPGKPIGAYVIAALVARPLFTGDRTTPTLERTITHDVGLGPEGFEYAVPVTLEGDDAMPLGHVDSPLAVYEEMFDPSVLSSSTRAATADGIVLTTKPLDAGARVDVIPTESIE